MIKLFDPSADDGRFSKKIIEDKRPAVNATRNAVRREKCQIDFRQVVDFDQRMLINQQANEHRRTQPMNPTESHPLSK